MSSYGYNKKFRITFNAPFVLTFVLICFVATLLGQLSDGRITANIFMIYHSPLTSPMTYVRLISHVFGHGGWDHFIGNASFLLLLGPLLEEKYGTRDLLIISLISALTTGLVQYIFFQDTALCGASGIVFTFILLSSFTGFHNREIPLTFLLIAILYVGTEIYDAVTVVDNISHMAHIIGGCIGGFFGYILNKKSDRL